MLGPSGSGKTTTLRMIAGFEDPSGGTIELAGEDVSGVPPYDRAVNTVFQDYALFPHMTVGDNVAYGLRVAGVDKAERAKRRDEALEMVRLPGYGERKPAELSGGQRQRVALARAIVNRPKVLLLDEPLGALDLKLREQMQVELKTIQGEVGITFVYVTHDQDEALTMSDRIAVFNEGRIEQVSPPDELYEQPETEFVAGFVGVSNLLERDGSRFTIRPEKIELLEAGRPGPGCTPSAAASPRSPTPARSPATRSASTPGESFSWFVRTSRARATMPRRSRGGGTRGLAAGARGRRRRQVNQRGGNTVRKEAHPARTAWLVVAGLLAVHARAGRLRLQRRQQQRRRRTAEARQGRGPGQPDLLGRLRRTRMDEAVRTGNRLQGQRQDRRHLRRNGPADADRRSTTASRPRATRPPAWSTAATSARSTSASSPTTRRSSPTSRTSPTTPSKAALRDPARPRRQPADVEHRRTSSRRRPPGK